MADAECSGWKRYCSVCCFRFHNLSSSSASKRRTTRNGGVPSRATTVPPGDHSLVLLARDLRRRGR
eukprot:6103848-Lingulodinium_polyedra.AAC.1